MARQPYDLPRPSSHCAAPCSAIQLCSKASELARRHWRPILFTDENSFTESTNDCLAMEWRCQGERYADFTIVKVDRYVGAHHGLDRNTLGWSYIPRGGVMAARHCSDILEPIVRPHACAIGDAFIVMQDNARANTAQASMTFIDDTGISVMNWPARSPYITPT